MKHTETQLPVLLDYRGVEKHFGLKASTMSKLVMLGKFIDVVKVGNKNFFKVTDIEAWIEKQIVKVG